MARDSLTLAGMKSEVLKSRVQKPDHSGVSVSGQGTREARTHQRLMMNSEYTPKALMLGELATVCL